MEGPSSAARRRRNLYLPLVAAIALFVAAVALTPRHETTPVELQALRGGHSGDDDDDDGASSDKHTSSHKPSDDGGDDGNDGASAHHAGRGDDMADDDFDDDDVRTHTKRKSSTHSYGSSNSSSNSTSSNSSSNSTSSNSSSTALSNSTWCNTTCDCTFGYRCSNTSFSCVKLAGGELDASRWCCGLTSRADLPQGLRRVHTSVVRILANHGEKNVLQPGRRTLQVRCS